jgi:hypothetical protein
MEDFNVVGLPDNAVKESRQRVKSALRNCGIEFPYGQGVTISLAPADLRNEGSGFDLPMALGLAGCQGAIFRESAGQDDVPGRVVAGRRHTFGGRSAFRGIGGAGGGVAAGGGPDQFARVDCSRWRRN